jgi:hypothetical protein
MKPYFSERNALTVITGIFCFVMTIMSALQHNIWQAVAFALAFSYQLKSFVIVPKREDKFR